MIQANKIMLVDDSISARHGMRKALTDVFPEAEIVEAKDADTAEIVFRDAEPELAILDYNMPGRNGLELAEVLLKSGTATRVVLCTANIQKPVKTRAAVLGIPVINKPIFPDKLRAALNGE